MAEHTTYDCQNCGYQTGKWLGRCPECSSWSSFVERTTRADHVPVRALVEPRPFSKIETSATQRMSTGLGEFDRVLGGGLVPGMVVLLAGEPGVGKSTLLLQAAASVAGKGRRVLYVTGEESASQLKTRGDRLGIDANDLHVAADNRVGAVIEAARLAPPSLLAVDSVQAVYCTDLGSVPGSISQVREAAARLVEFAKGSETPVIMIGHVTKDGSVAGPRALEHVVDTVIQFEGDRHHEHRILRALKNRFGPAAELGVFEMGSDGLREVANPSELFLAERQEDAPGSAVLAGIEGTRPLLVEVQALVGEPIQGSPRRTCLGVDANRVALILAVLQRRTGLQLADRDVYVNVTGGVALSEPAADLAVAAAIVSSSRRQPLAPGTVVAGEIGLTGEIRSISRIDARIRESARLGFARAILPARGLPASPPDIHTIPVRHLPDALDHLFS